MILRNLLFFIAILLFIGWVLIIFVWPHDGRVYHLLAVLAFTDRVDGLRFTDFDENSMYWYFVVGVAVVTDFVVYGASRLF